GEEKSCLRPRQAPFPPVQPEHAHLVCRRHPPHEPLAFADLVRHAHTPQKPCQMPKLAASPFHAPFHAPVPVSCPIFLLSAIVRTAALSIIVTSEFNHFMEGQNEQVWEKRSGFSFLFYRL